MASLRTPLCELLGCEAPILLAGMGGVARWELAAAVANLAKTQIFAQTSGLVQSRDVEPGDLVQPGRVLLTLARADSQEIRTGLNFSMPFGTPTPQADRGGPEPYLIWAGRPAGRP